MNLIFSYGSLVDKFPDKVLGPAKLIDYVELNEDNIFPELVLSQEEHTVEGFLLELDDLELKEADEYEDEGRYYLRASRDVEYNDRVFQAGIYFKY
jgi:gamma-glutamylcyclotransferase (GGCT)/AIG2-like uncharacterized protein YtfP